MLGTIMDRQLLLSRLIDYAAQAHSRTEVVGRRVAGDIERCTYAELRSRAKRLAKSLPRIGVKLDSCVASLAWNTVDHVELFYGVLGTGAALHTMNPRLSPQHLAYMVEKVGDTAVFIDPGTVEVAESFQDLVPMVRHWIFMGEEAELPPNQLRNLMLKRDLVEAVDDDFEWPEFDERQAATICFTSGTTGMPKGVAYTHRSLTLGAAEMAMADMYGSYRAGDLETAMPIAPIFHANGWQMPFSAPMNGWKLVLPGRAFDAASVVELMQAEAVTQAGAVPTVWRDIVDHLDRTGMQVPSLRTAIIAGTRVPPRLFDDFERLAINLHQTWGMTEAPGTTRATPPPGSAAFGPDEQRELRRNRQGRMAYMTELRLVDDDGQPLPNDGVATGRLVIRGPTVTGRYVGDPDEQAFDWLDTGDIARIFPDGTLEIVDRAKDVIKSGGEWISTLELETAAGTHPAVQQVAAIAIPDPKWQERPLLLCVRRSGREVSDSELRQHLLERVPKWWVPDQIQFVDSLPLTGTGKVNKVELRRRYAGDSRQLAS